MQLILYNDDFGVTYGLTDAVRESHLYGTTTAGSIRTNGLAFDYAVNEVLPAVPDLELGLHINLTEGPPDAPLSRVPHLVNGTGYYKRTFQQYYFWAQRDKELLKEIRLEIEAQFQKARDHGLQINHVNGHQHIHMIPPVFEIICQTVRDSGIKYVRIPAEPFFFCPNLDDTLFMLRNLNLIKHYLLNRLSRQAFKRLKFYGLSCVGCFVGVLYTGRMTTRTLKHAILKLRKLNIPAAEVLFHPANIDCSQDMKDRGCRIPDYYYSKDRRLEKENLLCQEMPELLKSQNIQLVNHGSLGLRS